MTLKEKQNNKRTMDISQIQYFITIMKIWIQKVHGKVCRLLRGWLRLQPYEQTDSTVWYTVIKSYRVLIESVIHKYLNHGLQMTPSTLNYIPEGNSSFSLAGCHFKGGKEKVRSFLSELLQLRCLRLRMSFESTSAPNQAGLECSSQMVFWPWTQNHLLGL